MINHKFRTLAGLLVSAAGLFTNSAFAATEFNIECHSSGGTPSLSSAQTTDTLGVRWFESGDLVHTEVDSANLISDCTNNSGYTYQSTESRLTNSSNVSVKLYASNDDALWINKASLLKSGSTVLNWGNSDSEGWCLSRDAAGFEAAWQGYVIDSKCYTCLEFDASGNVSACTEVEDAINNIGQKKAAVTQVYVSYLQLIQQAQQYNAMADTYSSNFFLKAFAAQLRNIANTLNAQAAALLASSTADEEHQAALDALENLLPFSALVSKTYGSIVGSASGTGFADIPNDASVISKIKVRSGPWIDAIQMTHRLSTEAAQSYSQHGGNGGGVSEFVLGDDEYITKITGEYGDYIGSITFHTNKRVSPTYGLASSNGSGSTYELSAPEGYEITGFQGRADNYLRAIGLVIRSLEVRDLYNFNSSGGNSGGSSGGSNLTACALSDINEPAEVHGAIYGGSGGNSFTDAPTATSQISKLSFRGGWWLDGMQVTRKLENGATQSSTAIGGNGGAPMEMSLSADEYITKVEGTYGDFVGQLVIYTNKGRKQSFGSGLGNGAGNSFVLTAPDSMAITGFRGRSDGHYLNAIGILVQPVKANCVDNSGGSNGGSGGSSGGSGGGSTNTNSAIVMDAIYGGNGGTAFSDLSLVNEPTTIKSIKVRSGWWVDSLQMTITREDGSTQTSARHGGSGGAQGEFVLQPGEYIKKITGSYGSVIGSITIHTNMRVSPAYGLGQAQGAGMTYELAAPEGYEIVGFHGRANGVLDALGIIVRER
ncbi:jacalin-like lectin [Pleionea sp. CnH1-48]|uniref:jacalin-like lectin n=1 Tax=Pleionea sp. CnH1-48 TaxID=2954494 RepID=UPI0020971B9C|nr:jacalin-like lectin [Pleionea sp. CnH1-48]MCO7227436.1 hypothetical protein [Pleionea sp. CnH1-48]